MANDKLRYEITADTKGFVAGVNKAQGSAKKLGTGKGKNRSGAAMNQLAYALDDAQYGFRGVQNNLQQIAVQSGASGPVVLALTALTIGIGYVIEHWEDFQTATDKAILTAKEFASEITKASGLNASLQVYADILKDSTSSTEAKQEALENLKKHGYDPAKQSLEEFLAAKKKEIALNAAQSVLEKKHGEAAEVLAEAEEKKLVIAQKQAAFNKLTGPLFTVSSRGGVLTRQTTKKGVLGNEILILEGEVRKLEEKAAELQARANAIYRGIIDSLLGNNAEGDAIGGGVDDIPDEFKDLLLTFDLTRDKLAEAFQQWIDTGVSGIEGLDEVFDTLDATVKSKLGETVETVSELGQALQSALGGSFGDIGEAIGDAIGGGDDIGGAFLKSLAKFMKAFGKALIAVGVAKLALKNSINNPVVAIAAGVALVAAGSALAAAESKQPGGGASGSNASRSTVPSAGTTPTSSRSDASSGQLVATVRGEDLRFILQSANDNYSARN